MFHVCTFDVIAKMKYRKINSLNNILAASKKYATLSNKIKIIGIRDHLQISLSVLSKSK